MKKNNKIKVVGTMKTINLNNKFLTLEITNEKKIQKR